jgi:general secretion pathway protein G
MLVQATADISALGAALGAFKVDNGRYPTSAEGLAVLSTDPSGLPKWKGPYIERPVGNDPWGNPYVYVCPGKHNPDSYDLHSFGPDGKDGTADDITNWDKR